MPLEMGLHKNEGRGGNGQAVPEHGDGGQMAGWKVRTREGHEGWCLRKFIEGLGRRNSGTIPAPATRGFVNKTFCPCRWFIGLSFGTVPERR